MQNDELKIISAQKLVEQLAGSVKIPPRLRRIPSKRALEIAKQRYFAKKYGLHRR